MPAGLPFQKRKAAAGRATPLPGASWAAVNLSPPICQAACQPTRKFLQLGKGRGANYPRGTPPRGGPAPFPVNHSLQAAHEGGQPVKGMKPGRVPAGRSNPDAVHAPAHAAHLHASGAPCPSPTPADGRGRPITLCKSGKTPGTHPRETR